MADLLGDDVFGDPNKVVAAPSTETSDVFASAVSTQEAPTPVPVPVPVVTPAPAVVAPATAAVPKSPPKQSIDLFADESPAKSAAPSIQPSNGVSSATSGSVNDIKVIISDPRKAGDGIGAFMVFTVKTETSRSGWGGKVFEVNRRFSDFLGLYEKLAGRYQHKGYFIFPAPEKSISSFTKVKIGNEDDMFVQRRQQQLQRWINNIAKHAALTRDIDFQGFLTQDTIAPATSTRALSAAGMLRFVGKVENVITKQVTQKMPETDSWFEDRAASVENLQAQLKRLSMASGNLSVHRRELGLSSGNLARASNMLANAEDKQDLSRRLANVGTIYENLGEIYTDLSDKDLYDFSELLSDQVRGLDGIKNILEARQKMWQNWQSSEQGLMKKRDTVTRLQATGRTEKIPGAELEIKEWETKAATSKKGFEDMTAVAKKEINTWETQRVAETKMFILKWMKHMLEAEKKVVAMWEKYLPKAQNVN